jgi:transposase
VARAKDGRFKYSPEFKQKAVDRMVAGECVSALARELGIGRRFLYAWREAGFGSAGPQPPMGGVKRREPASDSELQALALKNRISELEGLVGRQTAELDFFAVALRNMKESRLRNGGSSGNESMPRSKPLRKAR